MKKNIGVLAHVDAGKTSLSEQILYKTNASRLLGCVNDKNSMFDFDEIEKRRGITVFSTVATFKINENEFYLVDTPGHIDFTAQTERVLPVLDVAILVVSGVEGVESHTKTLWRLLKEYEIPAFLFINKLDRTVANKDMVLKNLRDVLSEDIIDFTGDYEEDVAQADEELLTEFLEKGILSNERIITLVKQRKLFPCFCGSALTGQGVDALLIAIDKYIITDYDIEKKFSAYSYKVGHDLKNNKLVYLKIKSGVLKVKDIINQEKVNEIRIYDGEKYVNVQKAEAGQICVITGVSTIAAGEWIGFECGKNNPLIVPTMKIETNSTNISAFKMLEEEEPLLNVEYTDKIRLSIMGDVQLEIIAEQMKTYFDEDILFSNPTILYKETIAAPVIGKGHYEPLRHYAEIVLKIEPWKRGGGIIFESSISLDDLDLSKQRLIETHIFEKEHKGVLSGSPLTDVKITLLYGKDHLKHTQGGDFREAVYRAVRQGLRKAKSVILEPFNSFFIEVPTENTGRVMMDLQRMNANIQVPFTIGETTVLEGVVPVSKIIGYSRNLSAFTKGKGIMVLNFYGYDICKEVLTFDYNPDSDRENDCGSVFCAYGAGFYVNWQDVDKYIYWNEQ